MILQSVLEESVFSYLDVALFLGDCDILGLDHILCTLVQAGTGKFRVQEILNYCLHKEYHLCLYGNP